MKICSQTLVKNEERFIWYSVMSVIAHVDKALIWDTGSSDKTVEIIGEIKKRYPKKVVFREVGEVTPESFTKVRQEMLDATYADWFLVVDGDEVWWEDSIKKVVNTIGERGKELESIVVPNYYLIGDIFHYQEDAAGRYELAGRRGNFNLRAVNRRIPGLRSDKPHGTWGWVDSEGKMIQGRNPEKIKLIEDAYYLHASFLQRSGSKDKDMNVPKRADKLKYEVGISFPSDFFYPEVFFKDKPDMVASPWEKMDNRYLLRALIQTPAKRVKRRLIHGKVGY